MMPLRRAHAGALVLVLLVAALAGGASAQGKMVRIGLLEYGSPSPSSDARWQGFRER